LLILSVNRISRILQFVWKLGNISRNPTRELIHELYAIRLSQRGYQLCTDYKLH